MNRLIPGKTKVQVELFRGVKIGDIVVSAIGLAMIILVLVSSLPYKLAFCIGIVLVAAVLLIRMDANPNYRYLMHVIAHFAYKRRYKRIYDDALLVERAQGVKMVTMVDRAFSGGRPGMRLRRKKQSPKSGRLPKKRRKSRTRRLKSRRKRRRTGRESARTSCSPTPRRRRKSRTRSFRGAGKRPRRSFTTVLPEAARLRHRRAHRDESSRAKKRTSFSKAIRSPRWKKRPSGKDAARKARSSHSREPGKMKRRSPGSGCRN